jgi:hypothetical protein
MLAILTQGLSKERQEDTKYTKYISKHLTMSMKYELEEPFFEEKGKITGQKEIGDNRSQTTDLSFGKPKVRH